MTYDGGATATAEVSFTVNALDAVATPTFDPAAKEYKEAQNVTISCATEGATIYYTTDVTDPTTSSTLYTAPITVSTDTTIKAIAVKDGMKNSDVATAAYTITPEYTVSTAVLIRILIIATFLSVYRTLHTLLHQFSNRS